MPTPIISVENLSKAYRLGHKEEAPDTLVAALAGAVKAPWRNWRNLRRLDTACQSDDSPDILWALRDVSFAVQQGEVVGIIGRNGAGKSTLLKILSRITEPTSGRIRLRGRVSSLLEVGTGFHPELTGRDNIYMNGTILGMKKREIDRKFDEIVDFSGVEKFLDTPVKRYSSGMTVRLAFAVAAHLEPEILIVDEVLAVGDAEFQKKCLGKMQDVAQGGRTVLFVSHNMAAVRSLTKSCIYLEKGRLRHQGQSPNVLDFYASRSLEYINNDDFSLDFFRRERLKEESAVQIQAITLLCGWRQSSSLPEISSGSPLTIEIKVQSRVIIGGVRMTLTLKRNQDERVITASSADQRMTFTLNPGINRIHCQVDDLPLSPGRYSVDVGISQGDRIKAFDVILDLPMFSVTLPEVESGAIDWPHRPWGNLHWRNITWSEY